ncbi:hypothetical protein Cgig2_031612 [Carnegiea gigantea]|uniref:Homeobox domain-containing protein n=1 Tax=Carnegiea gigantea TaxID=171969 RepID=A0A9Q1JZM3_9CARY|nr:hypothetical protein Cgig2_031612 [Carnegiea gigantea]
MAIQLHPNHGAPFSLYPTTRGVSDFDDGVYNLQRKTPLQLQTLENLYTDDKHPTQSRMEDYASALGLTYEQVRRWFIERRRRDKQNVGRSRGRGSKSAGNSAKKKCKTKNNKNVSNLAPGEDGNTRRGPLLAKDMLYSPDYILKKVFRKDGPLLGVEFDCLPSTAFQGNSGSSESGCSQASSQNEQRELKRRKVSKPANLNSEQHSQTRIPVKRHGMGKGLMSVLQLMNSQASSRDNVRESKRRKVDLIPHENNKAKRECCKLALNSASCEENLCSFETLADDEELELWELQAGSNPLTCSAHFTTGGTHACSLCKGLLPKFPPGSVRMKNPLSMHPWNSSLELVKKLFKDSVLIGKLHVCLLEFLLSDIEKELCDGVSIHSGKNRMFLNLLHAAEDQKFIVKCWKTSLNSLTWIEILRQVLVAAGFGSKEGILRKGCTGKETEDMVKYGLSPGTLKAELFSILLEQGNKGMKVTELAVSSRITELNPAKTEGELEDVICSTLASDITLFEKISSSTYRLRLASIMKKDGNQPDGEDCGSIDDESRECSVRSVNNSECDSGNPTSRLDAKHHSGGSSTLSLCTEIDESYPGESWLLGLMEGEYSDLSVEEKLNALLALVDLLSAGSSIRVQDPSRARADCLPSVYQHGSGGKIKRSSLRQPSLPNFARGDVREAFGIERIHQSSECRPVDSSVSSALSRVKEKPSSKLKNSHGAESGGHLHSMQSIFLGSDRRYNRYWLFLGPCDTDDPGHRRVYFESSEDGHWEVIDSEETFCGLLAALNSEGRREAALLASLEKRMSVLLDEMSSRMAIDTCMSQSAQSDISEIDRINEDSPSPISDIDNILPLAETSHNTAMSTCHPVFQVEKKIEEQKQKYARVQAYDLWVWNSFYSDLHAVKHGKRSYFESLTRCGSCHDLYWRDERHCKTCHKTFELDFDLEEKYAVHVATCRAAEHADTYQTHTVLPSQLQALKAAIHAIELVMPEDAFIAVWKKSARKLWVRRLRRTSSLHDLSQVLADFVGAFNIDWLSQCNIAIENDSVFKDIVSCFRSMPQTSSAIALWLVKLDSLLAARLIEGSEVRLSKGMILFEKFLLLDETF